MGARTTLAIVLTGLAAMSWHAPKAQAAVQGREPAPPAAGADAGAAAGRDAEGDIVSALNSGKRAEQLRSLVLMASEGRLGRPFPYRGTRLVRALIACLDDKDIENRMNAIRILGAIGDPVALEPLMGVIRASQPLYAKAKANRQRTAEVTELWPRKEAVVALGQIGGPKALAVLKDLAGKDDEDAVVSLAYSRDPVAVDILLPMLAHQGDRRLLVADGLGNFGGEKAARALHAAAIKDNSWQRPALRNAAFHSLSAPPEQRQSYPMRRLAATQDWAGKLIDAPNFKSPLFAGGKLEDVLAGARECPNLTGAILVDWAGLAQAGVTGKSAVRVDWKRLSQQAHAVPDGRTAKDAVTVVDVLWESLAGVSKPDQPVAAGLIGSCMVVSTLDRLIGLGPRIASTGPGDKLIQELNLSEGVPVRDALQFVQEYSGLRVEVDWAAMDKAGIGKDKIVKLHARNVRIVEAVWAILIETGGLGKVGCELKDGKLVIGALPKAASTQPSPRR